MDNTRRARLVKLAASLRNRLTTVLARHVPEEPGYAGLRFFSLRHGEKPVGKLVVESRGDVHKVTESRVQPEYRGMGLGSKLYGDAMRHLPGGSLNSDNVVSNDAAKLWERMGTRRQRTGENTYGTVARDPSAHATTFFAPNITDGMVQGVTTDHHTRSVFSGARLPQEALLNAQHTPS